jgi:hypothetical protein
MPVLSPAPLTSRIRNMLIRRLVATAVLCVAAAAQSTWIVNSNGGPGVHFPTLPAAVAAAASGDTIIVQNDPFNFGGAPFTTNKGLTIVGEGGGARIVTGPQTPIEVIGLPANETFRMVGFSRPIDGAMHVRLDGCAGRVHLENLVASEPDIIQLPGPSILIHQCADVTLRGIVGFGSPAVQIDASRVVLVSCQLGLTLIGLGGGQGVRANYSTIDIVEPRFDTGFVTQGGAIELVGCTTRLTGGPAAYV